MAKKKIDIRKRDTQEAEQPVSIYDSPIELPADFGISPTSGIVQREDGALEVSNIRIHRVGLEFTGAVTEEEYEVFGQTLLQIETAYQWIVGDYLAYGVDNNYGMAKEFAEQLGRDPATVNNWTSVCRNVTFSLRRENLSFKHHVIVSPLDEDDQVYWLEQASEHGWSSAKLQKMIAEANGENPEAKEQSYPALKKINSLAEMGEKEYSKLPEDVREEMIEAAQLFLKNARKWNKKL